MATGLFTHARAGLRKPGVIWRNPSHPYGRGLVGAWLFGERKGIVTADVSGRGHHGILSGGATWRTGPSGPVVDTPAPDAIVIPDHADWAFGDMTLIARVKFDSASSNRIGIVAQDPGGGFIDKWWFAYGNALFLGSFSGTAFFVIQGGSEEELHGTPWTMVADTWYTLAVTKTGLDYAFYRDRLPDGTVTATKPLPDVASDLMLGFAEATGYDFAGQYDYVRIYNRALAPSEIATLTAAPYDDLVRLSPMRFILRHVEPPPPPDVFRSASFPIEVLQGLGRSATFPIEALQGLRRSASFPIETLLTPELGLSLQWNETIPVDISFPLSWRELGDELEASLSLQWNETEELPSFSLAWRETPDLVPLERATVQRPTATVERTP